jgi:uncharacterized protein YkwD
MSALHRRLLSLFLAAGLLVPLAACGVGEIVQGLKGGTQDSGALDATGDPVDPNATMSPDEEAWALEVLGRVNQERIARGLPALAWHPEAAGVAYRHGLDMRSRGFFDHVNPDGLDPADRLDAAGIVARPVGENIARGQDDPASVMAAWMASDGHRENILYPGFTHLGVGVVRASGGPWWVQVFLTP